MIRPKSRLILFISMLALVFMGSTVYYSIKSENYSQYIQYSNERALSDLISDLSQMDSSLSKLRYAETPKSFQTIAAQLWQSAKNAKTSLTALGLEPGALDQTQKFISQTGDFAYYLLFSSAGGESLSDEHRESLNSLCDTSDAITREISSIKGQVNAKQLSFQGVTKGQDLNVGAGLNDSLSGVEQEFPEYATLIYDGPFSEHLAYSKPRLLENLPEVTLEQAIKNASSFSGVPVSDISLMYEGGDKIQRYCLSTVDGATMEVSKQGGIIFTYRKDRDIGTSVLDTAQATEKALEFLANRGFTSLKQSYYTLYEGLITINFAFVQNDIIAYGDLIKVSVALDDGEILGMEARGFVMSHTSRTLPRPAVSAADAKISETLTVNSVNLALIPTSGENEVFCYEYVCTDKNGMHVIIYINTQTGQEENIYILIEDENGVLTI
ncbi:MAG: germination protein YpeB [Clostridiaceae bacterium]|nr:germination protein YpeB [Clostridiaceae bacterium]